MSLCGLITISITEQLFLKFMLWTILTVLVKGTSLWGIILAPNPGDSQIHHNGNEQGQCNCGEKVGFVQIFISELTNMCPKDLVKSLLKATRYFLAYYDTEYKLFNETKKGLSALLKGLGPVYVCIGSQLSKEFAKECVTMSTPEELRSTHWMDEWNWFAITTILDCLQWCNNIHLYSLDRRAVCVTSISLLVW